VPTGAPGHGAVEIARKDLKGDVMRTGCASDWRKNDEGPKIIFAFGARSAGLVSEGMKAKEGAEAVRRPFWIARARRTLVYRDGPGPVFYDCGMINSA